MKRVALLLFPFVSLFVMLFSSCEKTYIQEKRNSLVFGIDNAYVLEARYIQHTGNELFIEARVSRGGRHQWPCRAAASRQAQDGQAGNFFH